MAEKEKLAQGTAPKAGRQSRSSRLSKLGTINVRAIFRNLSPVVAGMALALVLGWFVLPDLMFVKKTQPVNFNHVLHAEKTKKSCADCHSLREDGSFQGLPGIAVCAECHTKPQGSGAAEAAFRKDYVLEGREVPWLVYQKQPDNVFFSHAAHTVDNCNKCHSFKPAELCSLCHPNVAAKRTLPPVEVNWMTGYSKDTMKMNVCERCHAHPRHLAANNTPEKPTTNANNACFVCHK